MPSSCPLAPHRSWEEAGGSPLQPHSGTKRCGFSPGTGCSLWRIRGTLIPKCFTYLTCIHWLKAGKGGLDKTGNVLHPAPFFHTHQERAYRIKAEVSLVKSNTRAGILTDIFSPQLRLTLQVTWFPQSKGVGCSFPQSIAMMWCSGTNHWLTLHLKPALSKPLACALTEVSCYLQPALRRPAYCLEQHFLVIVLKEKEREYQTAATAPPTPGKKHS